MLFSMHALIYSVTCLTYNECSIKEYLSDLMLAYAGIVHLPPVCTTVQHLITRVLYIAEMSMVMQGKMHLIMDSS